MNGERIRDHVRECVRREDKRRERTSVLALPVRERRGQLFAVLGAKPRRVEVQKGAVEAVHVVSGVSPRARASRTS